MDHHVPTDRPRLQTGASHDERDTNPLFIQKLFASRVTDSVIRHEEDVSIVIDAFRFQPLDNLSHLNIRVHGGIEILRPIIKNYRIVRIIRRQFYIRRIHRLRRFFRSALAT